MQPVSADSRPRLAPGVRLRFDERRDTWLLLAPERVIETEGPVSEIVSRFDGLRSVGEIAGELAAVYTTSRSEILADIIDLVTELAGKRLVLL